MPYLSQYLPFYLSAPPSVLTVAATHITPTKATLNGVVVANGLPTKYFFQYAAPKAAWSTIPATMDGDGSEGAEEKAVSQVAVELEPGVTYKFRLRAENEEGGSTGEELEFTTLALPKVIRRHKPSLALDLEIEGLAGNFTLASDSRKASDRPRAMSGSTLRGDGFGPGGATLSRKMFKAYADEGLLDTWRLVSHSGDVAYEGRYRAGPRTNEPQEQVDASLVGWATYLKSRKVAPLVVDRRFSGWQEPGLSRRKQLLEAAWTFAHYTASSDFDGLKFQGESGTAIPAAAVAELIFNAGDVNSISKVMYRGTEQNTGNVEAATLYTDSEETFPSPNSVALTLDNTFRTAVPATSERYALLRALATATHTPEVGKAFARTLQFLALYGNTGLATRAVTGEPDAVYLTDLIKYIVNTWYPKIDTSAMQSNTTLVQQAAWQDNPQFGYDIVAELNKLALWELNVWEQRKLHYEQADLTKYDWQFSTDDPGVTVLFEGESIENFANGIEVTYTDVLTGIKHTLYPSDHKELRDESESNPANRHGESLWTEVEVPWQCTEAEALQIGRAYLPAYNRPKRPGSYTITGHIEDPARNWHPYWEPRCSQTVGILDHPDDAPRLITATSFDSESMQTRITVDAPEQVIDAVVARQRTAGEARNLT